jgi:hypothetical protein
MHNFLEIVKCKTNAELLVMVYQLGEWSPEMLQAVEEELKIRNILPKELSEKKQMMIAEEELILSKGKAASSMGQLFGWISILLGIVGIYIGYNYAYGKVRSKYTNKTFYKYDEDSRQIGSYIFIISIIVMVIGILYRISINM